MSEFMPVNDVNNMKQLVVAADVLPLANAVTEKRKKKKSGAFGIFKAALYILRKKPDEKEAAKKKIVESDGSWKMLVGSMRPLQLQEAPQSPMYPMSPGMEDMVCPASPAASSSCGTMSQYASALNLRDLDDNIEDEAAEDPDEVFDAVAGDDMIDAKAEEFIAQFYKQIQQQNTSRFHHQDMGY